MAQQNWQAVLVPSSDPHLSEYLPERWQGRVWLSGFTGSSGTLLVSATQAALFTDSRYWEQAEAELAGSVASRRRQAASDESLSARFDRLAADEDVERELAQIKARRAL